jgi:hypothetical protein
MRRLRVLSEHPHLGKPNDLCDGFEGAQAYVDAGLAEWVVDRSDEVDTAMAEPATEVAVRRRPARRAPRAEQ